MLKGAACSNALTDNFVRRDGHGRAVDILNDCPSLIADGRRRHRSGPVQCRAADAQVSKPLGSPQPTLIRSSLGIVIGEFPANMALYKVTLLSYSLCTMFTHTAFRWDQLAGSPCSFSCSAWSALSRHSKRAMDHTSQHVSCSA